MNDLKFHEPPVLIDPPGANVPSTNPKNPLAKYGVAIDLKRLLSAPEPSPVFKRRIEILSDVIDALKNDGRRTATMEEITKVVIHIGKAGEFGPEANFRNNIGNCLGLSGLGLKRNWGHRLRHYFLYP